MHVHTNRFEHRACLWLQHRKRRFVTLLFKFLPGNPEDLEQPGCVNKDKCIQIKPNKKIKCTHAHTSKLHNLAWLSILTKFHHPVLCVLKGLLGAMHHGSRGFLLGNWLVLINTPLMFNPESLGHIHSHIHSVQLHLHTCRESRDGWDVSNTHSHVKLTNSTHSCA